MDIILLHNLLSAASRDFLATLGVMIPEGDDGAGLRAGATRLLAALDEPFRLAGCEFSLSTSVGVAVYPDDGRDAEILLDRADMAMYRAKEAGRNGVEFFTPGMDSVGSERLSLEHALRGGGFVAGQRQDGFDAALAIPDQTAD